MASPPAVQAQGQTFAGRCAHPEVTAEATFREAYADLLPGGAWPASAQQPVVYTPGYNITFGGLERIHPFDSAKFSKVVQQLIRRGLLASSQVVTPLEVRPPSQAQAARVWQPFTDPHLKLHALRTHAPQATREVLADVHDAAYLESLHKSSVRVAQVLGRLKEGGPLGTPRLRVLPSHHARPEVCGAICVCLPGATHR